ncbi:hypothetical protein [Marinobacter salicampi]|uniref:hypothetical protein n=1 Tax=Marinobacter salicampi TaxID=435907 RepID=UPI00140A2EB3|nr:hypothetical protein [Marinobacter salicampi]
MNKLLTFVVPLRSPQASKDWENVLSRLDETASSIQAACGFSTDVRAVVVANRDAKLRPLPECFQVIRVDLKPPTVSVFRGESPEEERTKAVRWDKGYKIATGMIHAKNTGSRFVMGVDADDLIASDIAQVARAESDGFGWYIDKGWLLPMRSKWGLILPDFQNWCGTYAMVRTDLLGLPANVDEMEPDIVSSIYGHHRCLLPEMKKRGTPLQPFGYPAAVYRVNHSDGNFARGGLTEGLLAPRKLLSRPFNYLKWASRLRLFDERQKKCFLGSRAF